MTIPAIVVVSIMTLRMLPMANAFLSIAAVSAAPQSKSETKNTTYRNAIAAFENQSSRLTRFSKSFRFFVSGNCGNLCLYLCAVFIGTLWPHRSIQCAPRPNIFSMRVWSTEPTVSNAMPNISQPCSKPTLPWGHQRSALRLSMGACEKACPVRNCIYSSHEYTSYGYYSNGECSVWLPFIGRNLKSNGRTSR